MDEKESCALCRRGKWCPLCNWSAESWAFLLLRLYLGLSYISWAGFFWAIGHPKEGGKFTTVTGQLIECYRWDAWMKFEVVVGSLLGLALLLGIKTRAVLIAAAFVSIGLSLRYGQLGGTHMEILTIAIALVLSKHNRLELVKD